MKNHAETRTARDAGAAHDRSSKVRKVILVADDNRLHHQMCTDILAADYDLLHAYDGADALKMAIAHAPDAVLLDIMMPLLDGRAVCQKLRELPPTRKLKIVILSAKDSHFDRRLGLELGADDYLEKPCPPEYLRSAMKRLFRPR